MSKGLFILLASALLSLEANACKGGGSGGGGGVVSRCASFSNDGGSGVGNFVRVLDVKAEGVSFEVLKKLLDGSTAVEIYYSSNSDLKHDRALAASLANSLKSGTWAELIKFY